MGVVVLMPIVEHMEDLARIAIMLYRDYMDINRNEPLDGDAVDHMIQLIWCEVNLDQGNITDEEYDDYMDKPMIMISADDWQEMIKQANIRSFDF